jgi:colanic acid/amylovoran biosynthesis glycosyltransferase
MKIIYVTSMLPFGPMEAFFIPEVRELRRRGHEVVLVPMWPRGAVMHEDARELLETTIGAPLLSPRIACAAAAEVAAHPVRSMRSLAVLKKSRSGRVLAKNVAVCPKALWLARLVRRLRADHIHAQWGATTATMAWVAHMVTGVPWSFTVHRWDIAENNLLQQKAASARFVRAISVTGAKAVRRYLGPHASKGRLLHMGVDLPAGPRAAGDQRTLRVITAANLLEIKGHKYLLEAVARLACSGVEVILELAGGGPLLGEVRLRAEQLRIEDRVMFLGVLPHAELVAGLQSGRWDVAVLPSISLPDGEQEGIPVFLMEAMASGVPVVSTRTGGIPELVTDGAGILVAEKDASGLAGALERLSKDHSLRRALGERGATVVRDGFSVEAVMRVFESWMIDREQQAAA